MSFHVLARQTHRWLSILFTGMSILLWLLLGLGVAVPQWAYFLPLAPLLVMMLTGLYMFFRPYVGRRSAA